MQENRPANFKNSKKKKKNWYGNLHLYSSVEFIGPTEKLTFLDNMATLFCVCTNMCVCARVCMHTHTHITSYTFQTAQC